MTRAKLVAFAAAAALVAVTLLLVAFFGVDLYLHHRAERSAGLNRWGYRGAVLGRKAPGETRVALLGGSTMFGYGVTWEEAIPALLERELTQREPGRAWRTINLGYNTEGAFAFLPNLQDFAHLDYDIVCLYEGYNDLLGDIAPNWVVVRHQSPVFRLTGYFPILPLAFREKAMALRNNSSVGSGYQPAVADKTVFRPGLATRTSAGALDAAAGIAESLSRQFEGLAPLPADRVISGDRGCPSPWGSYCDSVLKAVQYALTAGKRVIVVSQPQLTELRVRERHDSQQQSLAGMLQREFGSNPAVRYFNLGTIVDLSDLAVSFDRMHLNLEGNRLVAAALADPIRQTAVLK